MYLLQFGHKHKGLRFYSAVDIVLEEKPVVIMISQVHKTVKGKTPYSLIDPETEAIQIKGRFRNDISRYR